MSDLHIASLVVRVRPDSAQSLAERIARRSGTEVHAVEDGKIIVVLEASTERLLADRMDELRHEPGVLLVNLVYHHMDAT